MELEDRAEAKVGTASMMYDSEINISINFIANYMQMQMWRTYIQLIARPAAAVMSVLWSSDKISRCSTQQLVDLTATPKHPGTPKHQ